MSISISQLVAARGAVARRLDQFDQLANSLPPGNNKQTAEICYGVVTTIFDALDAAIKDVAK